MFRTYILFEYICTIHIGNIDTLAIDDTLYAVQNELSVIVLDRVVVGVKIFCYPIVIDMNQ